MVRILLIEDDSTIAAGLAYSLEQEGWSVTCKGTLAQGRNALETGEYQLLLVDVGLPDGSGYDLCAAAKSRNIPVIFATARGDEGSVVLGLDMGADDYIVKPFRLREVASRIRAVLRRAAGEREQLVRLGELAVDTQKGQVTRNGTPILLTALEYRLLLTFLSHPGQTLTRGQLLEGIWDVAGNFVNDNTLSVYIKRLRDKLEMPGHPLISTVRGMGYRLEVDFRKMIWLESLFYGIKALCWSLPFGMGVLALEYYAIRRAFQLPFCLPVGSIVLAVVLVMGVCWISGLLTRRSLEEQTITEAIQKRLF